MTNVSLVTVADHDRIAIVAHGHFDGWLVERTYADTEWYPPGIDETKEASRSTDTVGRRVLDAGFAPDALGIEVVPAHHIAAYRHCHCVPSIRTSCGHGPQPGIVASSKMPTSVLLRIRAVPSARHRALRHQLMRRANPMWMDRAWAPHLGDQPLGPMRVLIHREVSFGSDGSNPAV